MNEHVYKQIELTGSSKTSIEMPFRARSLKRPRRFTICVGFTSLRVAVTSKMARWIIGRLQLS
jgi:hypothetical protein